MGLLESRAIPEEIRVEQAGRVNGWVRVIAEVHLTTRQACVAAKHSWQRLEGLG